MLHLKCYFFHSQWICPQSCAMESRESLHRTKMLFFQISKYSSQHQLFDGKGYFLQLHLHLNWKTTATKNNEKPKIPDKMVYLGRSQVCFLLGFRVGVYYDQYTTQRQEH